MLEPGQIFASRYRVRRCIAEGGMGVIFDAEHLGTERRVALKLLFPHVMSIGNAREKFELEAKISARVNSPYIVQVLDAGIDPETAAPYLAMELLEGETLAQRVSTEGPLPVERALPLLEQVAAGLDAAHGYREPGGAPKPIVHRDLKPENLFLAVAPGGSQSAKILDFGIAKMLDERLSVSQEVRGTPLFMAVEQITASSLSPQTDVWAYGLIAHYALTGAHYWRSSWREDVSVQALFAEILTLPLDAPSLRWREQGVVTALPPAFDAWLLRCVAREPAERFPSAGAAFEALVQALGGAAGPSASREPPAAAAGGVSAESVSGAASAEQNGQRGPQPTPGAQPAAHAPQAKASSTGSVSAMSTTQHRAPLAVLSARLRRSHWIAGAAGVAAVAAALVVWAVAGSAPPAPAHALGSPARDAAPLGSPGEPGVREAAPAAASTVSALTPAPASPALAAPAADSPRVRVAPVVEPAVVTPSEAASSSKPAASSEPASASEAARLAEPSASDRSSAVNAAAKAPGAAQPRRHERRRAQGVSDAYRMR